MTTLSGRDKSALLVIDVQNGVVEGAFNLKSVLENINSAIAKARAAGVPVIWVQHSDEELRTGRSKSAHWSQLEQVLQRDLLLYRLEHVVPLYSQL